MKSFLRIEKPCEESLDKMHDLSDGKFCDLCSKKVLDLSNLNDSEILNIIQQNKGERLCGIVFKNQLNRSLQPQVSFSENPHSRKANFTKIAAGVALTASIFNSYPAQTKIVTKTEFVSSQSKISQENKKEEDKIGDGNISISGKVVLKESNAPQNNITVELITIHKVYSTQTDINGIYTLEIPKEIIKQDNLLRFDIGDSSFINQFAIFTKDELAKKNITKISANGYFKEYGEISPLFATENSLVFLNGRKLDYKLFNKSFSLYYKQYNLYHIPKEYKVVFTTDKNINDLFIAFVK